MVLIDTLPRRRSLEPLETPYPAWEPADDASGPKEPGRSRASTARRPWWRRPGRPGWSVPARGGIFGLAALLYSWNLARVGVGNAFYAAAIKSGTESWKAFFFGSLDPGSFITVDKPPAALWFMELSARLFGFSSWSVLLPDALAGVATVMVLYHLVRLWYGEPAAVLAASALALTPVVVVIFRFDDPDAFLTLLLTLAAWACWHATTSGRTGGLVVSGALVGLAFLTKTLDAFIVVPAFGVTYLCCAPPRLGRRIAQLGWAALALFCSSSWWVAIVELSSKGARPYVGGSADDSVLNLILGYNGLMRVAGSHRWSTGGQGLLRMFDTEVGGQISWFLPLAVVGVFGGLCLTRGRRRSDRELAGFVLWGGTFLTYFAVYDDARGIFHPYYTVVMAPAVAALAGAGTTALWRLGRRSPRWAWVLPATVVGTALWAAVLLARTSGYDPWLGPAVIVAGAVAALALFLALTRRATARWFGVVAGVAAAASILAGPAAYSLTTIGNVTTISALAGPEGTASPVWSAPVGRGLVDYLERHEGSASYLGAVTGSQTAAQIILQSGKPVIAMGGYTGLDPAPTLSGFRHLVAAGEVRYVYVHTGAVLGSWYGNATVASVDTWVEKHGTVVPPSRYGGARTGWALFDVDGSTNGTADTDQSAAPAPAERSR